MTSFKCFKLYDYNIIEESTKGNPYKDNKKFIIQAFGINSSNKTASIFIENFYPFFYIKVNEKWDEQRKNEFIGHLKKVVLGKRSNFCSQTSLSPKGTDAKLNEENA